MKKFLVILSIILTLSLILCGCTEPADNTESTASNPTSSDVSSTVSEPETSSEASSEPTGPVVETRTTFHNFSLILPEGYTWSEANGIYTIFNPEYPVHSDNINVNHIAAGDNPANYTADILNGALGPVFEEFSGVQDLMTLTLDGVPFLVYSYTGTVGGIEMIFTQGILFGSNYTDTITFTQLDTTFDDDFGGIFLSLKVAA